MTARRLAVLAAFSGQGGVEKMVLNLLDGFAAYDLPVDLLPILRKHHPLPAIANDRVRVIDLGVRHTALALPAVCRYLRRESPDALLAVRDRAIRTAVLARRLTGSKLPVVGNLHSHLSASLENKSALRRWWRTRSSRRLYAAVDRIIAVSDGVADDTRRLAGLTADRVVTVRNPVIDDGFWLRSRAQVEHPEWLGDGEPLIVGAGRLTEQKDFATLIRAFALLRQTRPCRLLILGEGRQRGDLQDLVAGLGLSDGVRLPGFVANPYPYMARASLFALSSRWEGSGNVLTEAMALGVPVVSTDCPAGPAEILAAGRLGPLTPVGDVAKLADAMARMLERPTPAEDLRAAAEDFTVRRAARGYLAALGFDDLLT